MFELDDDQFFCDTSYIQVLHNQRDAISNRLVIEKGISLLSSYIVQQNSEREGFEPPLPLRVNLIPSHLRTNQGNSSQHLTAEKFGC